LMVVLRLIGPLRPAFLCQLRRMYLLLLITPFHRKLHGFLHKRKIWFHLLSYIIINIVLAISQHLTHSTMTKTTQTILLSSALLSSAIAQLLTCGDVGCPVSPNGVVDNCTLEGERAWEIGITTVDTTLDQRPLAWTLAVKIDFKTDALDVYHRDFYLGQPPSLDLESTTSTNGCALFFDGISSDLNFGVSYPPNGRDNGTCDDALTSVCVTEWKAQIQTEVNGALQNGSSLDCDALAQTLQSNPPATCATNHDSWGTVFARRKMTPYSRVIHNTG
jgi:hypothetical protein